MKKRRRLLAAIGLAAMLVTALAIYTSGAFSGLETELPQPCQIPEEKIGEDFPGITWRLLLDVAAVWLICGGVTVLIHAVVNRRR